MATKKNYLYFGGERANPITTEFEFDESEVWNSTEVASTEPKRSIFSPKKIANRNDHAIDHGIAVAAASLPVNVPDWSNILQGEYNNNRRIENGDNNGDDVNCDHEDDSIPPHVYLARTRIASFSVQEGIGRTLKGRDMRRVRNAIWKQTGFED